MRSASRIRLMVGFVALLIMVLAAPRALGESPAAQQDTLILSNEFIAIMVNNSEDANGRFSVNTTGGDPGRVGDENKPLIYGTVRPWTSYTTIKIDQDEFVFGGRTQKRAGKTGQYGTWIMGPEIVEGRWIKTVYQVGPLEATQLLSLTRSTTTALYDTARIEYVMVNKDTVSHEVGLRLMLDTMVGSNDGAPFRVHEESVTADTRYEGKAIPQFFQAFDSLSDPQVTSQGTLAGGEITQPDRVFFTNWGTVADDDWEFDFQPGRDFTRKGELELDSAIAMYWDPKPLAPGETRSYVVYYGLGGITIAPGSLSIGVTSPATVIASKSGAETFPVIAYIENTGEGIAQDVATTIDLPKGLKLVEGTSSRELGHLEPGASAQVRWTVTPTIVENRSLTFTVRVTSSNSDPNKVERTIQVVSPAKLEVSLQGPLGLTVVSGKVQPDPFEVTAILKNTGGSDAYRVRAEMNSPVLGLARGESDVKYVGSLGPGETVTLHWQFSPVGFTGRLPYSLKAGALNTDDAVANNFVLVPAVNPGVELSPRTGEVVRTERVGRGTHVNVGQSFIIDINAINLPSFYGARLRISYDPTVVQLIGGKLGVDRGTLYLDMERPEQQRYLGFSVESVDQARGEIVLSGVRLDQGVLDKASGTLGSLRFRAIAEGSTNLTVSGLEWIDQDGNVKEERALKPRDLEIVVEAGEK